MMLPQFRPVAYTPAIKKHSAHLNVFLGVMRASLRIRHRKLQHFSGHEGYKMLKPHPAH
jgi:hypothetical protein